MSIRSVSDCVNCETCIGCSRYRDRKAVICDRCEQEIDGNVYLIQDYHLCQECALESLESVCVEDLLDD